MTHVTDEAKLNKFFRFMNGVSGRALKGSLDIEQFIKVVQVLLDKNVRATNLAEYIAQGYPMVDYEQPMPKAKIRRQKPSALVVDLDATPLIPKGWTVESHQQGGQFAFDGVQLNLYLAAGQTNGKYIFGFGNKLRQELAKQPVLNANVLDFLLANSHLIPEEWKGKAVFFWGTVYRGQLVCPVPGLERWPVGLGCRLAGRRLVWLPPCPRVPQVALRPRSFYSGTLTLKPLTSRFTTWGHFF